MPASSRKRNKGRDRKAKKEESKRVAMYDSWQGWASGRNRATGEHAQCNHGLVTTIPDLSHPVSSFITEYLLCYDVNDTYMALQNIAEGLDDSYRKLAIDILILIGANLMLCKNTAVFVTGREAAFAIVVLEKYEELHDFQSTLNCRVVSNKVRDLTVSNTDRDLLKFFRKRLNCSCLKKMHLEARKTQPKLGYCEYCKEVKERRLLMVCSRCRVSQYCSRDCHVAASPEHRLHCNLRVRAEQIVANNNVLDE